MADLTITASAVVPAAGSQTTRVTAGATITAGQVVYMDVNGVAQLARANSATTDDAIGIAVSGSSSGQPLTIVSSGPLSFGSIISTGKIYVLSAAAAGGIAPIDDIAIGDYVTRIGYGLNATQIQVDLNTTSVQANAAVT